MNTLSLPLNENEKKRRAKTIEISLIAKIRKKSSDPRYIELGERLEKLREKYESGVISSINWLKELLDAARETVHLDNALTAMIKLLGTIKTDLSELFKEVRNDQTPEIISRIVDDIDKIVKATCFHRLAKYHCR